MSTQTLIPNKKPAVKDTFAKQAILQQNWQPLMDIAHRQSAQEVILPYETLVEKFVMKTPLVGIFSAGKSSLINTLIGEKLLPTALDPKTCIATEIQYCPNRTFMGHLSNGTKITLSQEDVQSESFVQYIESSDDKQGWVSAGIDVAVLKSLPHVCLVDLPGIESNFDEHQRMILSYIPKSVAYCMVVTAEDGELKKSVQDFLSNLKANQMPVLLIITKIDIKPPQEIDDICQKTTESATKLLGKPPLRVVRTSARKKEAMHELIDALRELENLAEKRFDEVVVRPLVDEMAFMIHMLDKKLSADNLDLEQLCHQKEMLDEEMAIFNKELDEQTQLLESNTASIIQNIGNLVESRLLDKANTLARQLSNGSDINSALESTVRMAISEGIQQYLMPQIKDYVAGVQDTLPMSLQHQSSIVPYNHSEESAGVGALLTSMSPLLALMKINPVLSAISVALPVVAGIINAFMSGQNRKQEEEERKRLAREELIHEIIPSVQAQVAQNLTQTVKDNINHAKAQLSKQAKQKEAQVQANLDQLHAKINESKAEQERLQESYLADKAVLMTLIEKLNMAHQS